MPVTRKKKQEPKPHRLPNILLLSDEELNSFIQQMNKLRDTVEMAGAKKFRENEERKKREQEEETLLSEHDKIRRDIDKESKELGSSKIGKPFKKKRKGKLEKLIEEFEHLSPEKQQEILTELRKG